MAGTVKVVAVDDHEVFLQVAAQVIAATPGFEEVGHATSGPAALELVASVRPDLVLLDVRMPRIDGIELATKLIGTGTDAVVVLTSLEDVNDLPSSLATAGAAALLRKQDLSTVALRRIWAAHGPRRAL